MRHPVRITAIIVLAVRAFVGCALERSPPPPEREALARRQTRLDEAAARIEEIAGATAEDCSSHFGHPDHRVRRAAALRLIETGDPAGIAVPGLVALLRDDDTPRVRTAAARVLGVLGDQRSIAPLIAALADQEREVRFWSWKALRGQGDEAYAELVSSLTKDPDSGDLYYLDELGAAISLQSEIERLLPLIGEPIVRHLLDDMEAGAGGATIEALRVMKRIGPGAEAAAPALAKLLETGNQEQRHQAALVLGAIGNVDPAVVAALKRASKDKAGQVRSAAEQALKDIAEAAKARKPERPQKKQQKPSAATAKGGLVPGMPRYSRKTAADAGAED